MWKAGDGFVGDPPQEPQGLYCVFDSDKSTIAIISRHARQLSRAALKRSSLQVIAGRAATREASAEPGPVQRSIVVAQRRQRKRLGQIVVHAGRDAGLAVSRHRIAGERDDGHAPPVASAARMARAAARPSITGIWQSMRISIEIRIGGRGLHAFLPFEPR